MAEIVSFKRVSPSADAHLAAIVDSSYDAIVSKDLNSVITSWNAAAERLFGYTAAEAIGRSVLMLIPDGLKGEEADIIQRVRRGERVASYETMRQRKDGTLVAVSLTISPILGSDGEIIGASKIARDISAAKESERRIKLLMREVNHRVKNQFAVILSMIRETGRWSTDPRDFEERVRDRIMALSRSHDLLVTSEWSGASLVELIQEHLKPFGHERQVSLSGPLLELHPNTVQHFGMALHELGTNSAKYGALSGSAGRVNISWQVATNVSGEQEFSFTWDETSIPRQVPPETEARKGFGSVVLQRVAPQALGGSAVLDRVPGHMRWTLVAPASAIIGEGELDARDGA